MGELERRLSDLGTMLAREQDERLRQVDLSEGRERLLRASARGLRPRRVTAAGAASALALAAAILLFFFTRPDPLRFSVGSEPLPGSVGAWIAAPEKAALPLHFSDGTELRLEPDARARVVEVEALGARVVLEKGQLAAAVIHREKSRWTVNVGPFEVLVTGTRFNVSWAPESETFRLELQEGSVVVSGPLLDDRRTVTSGQTLSVHCKEGRLELSTKASLSTPPSGAVDGSSAAARAEPVPSAFAPSQSARAQAAASGAPVAPLASAAEAPRPSFRELAKSGKYEEALRAAEEEGFTDLCERASAGDLLALADAARFAGKPARAAEALNALRRRFSGSGQAATAAFHLGRMAFDSRGAHAEAARWFSTYLAEQPGGALAREAEGRLMECREKMGDTAGAREAARRYLDAYPGGPHAEKARSLLVE
jgi:transmembrane sensor